MLPYLTRALGVEGYATLAYYQTIIVFITLFIGLSQDAAFSRYYFFYGKRSSNIVFNVGLLFALSTSLLSLIILKILNLTNLYLLVFYAFFQVVFMLQVKFWQVKKSPFKYMLMQIGSSLLAVFLTIFLFELVLESPENRILSILISFLIVSLISFLFFYRKNFKKLHFSMRNYRYALLYILSFGGGLTIHAFSLALRGQIDRLFINSFYTDYELGIYSVSFQIASILSLIIISINKAISPYFYEALKENKLTREKLLSFLKIGILVSPTPFLINLVIPEDLYFLLLGNEFIGVKDITSFFLLGIGFQLPYFILGNYFHYHGLTNEIVKMTIFSSICYLGVMYFVLPIGINWMPLSLLISNIILTLLIFMRFMSISKGLSAKK